MLVSASGTLLQARDLCKTDFPHQVDVAYNWRSNEYFVVFVRSYNELTTGNDIYSVRVDEHNNLIRMGLGAIYSAAKHQNAPRVAVDGNGDMMVVWEHQHSSTNDDIFGVKLDERGDPKGLIHPLANESYDEKAPAIAAGFVGSQFLAVWQELSALRPVIAARSWGMGRPAQVFRVSGAGFWEYVKPAVAANPPRYFIAYEGEPVGDPTAVRHIYGRQWAMPSVWLPGVMRRP
jgi:hypothetical protein